MRNWQKSVESALRVRVEGLKPWAVLLSHFVATATHTPTRRHASTLAPLLAPLAQLALLALVIVAASASATQASADRDLGLTLYRPDTMPEYSITDCRDDLTVVSAKQDLRVEFPDSERPVVIANADNSRQPLANANPGETNKTTTYSSEVYISPDSRWVLQIAWRTHGNREPRYSNAFLFEVKQVAPLHLQPYPAGGSFGELAKQHFQVPANSYADIHFVDWKEDKLVFTFTVRPDVEPHEGDDGVDWQCEFDLRQATFSSPEKLPGSSRFIGSGE